MGSAIRPGALWSCDGLALLHGRVRSDVPEGHGADCQLSELRRATQCHGLPVVRDGLLMGLRSMVEGIGLLRKAQKAGDAIERESVNYDFRITLAKGIGRLFLGALLVSVPVIVQYLGNETAIGATLVAAGLSPAVAAALAVFLSALARMASNYSKNK